MTLTRRKRLNIWWRYIGAPRAHGIATIGIYLAIIAFLVLNLIVLIR